MRYHASFGWLGLRLDYRRERSASSTDSALGLAFVREGITEKGDDAIAQSLEHVTVVPGNTDRAGVLVAADDPLQHFGVQAGGELGKAHHVAEKHGKLATLALGRMLWRR